MKLIIFQLLLPIVTEKIIFYEISPKIIVILPIKAALSQAVFSFGQNYALEGVTLKYTKQPSIRHHRTLGCFAIYGKEVNASFLS